MKKIFGFAAVVAMVAAANVKMASTSKILETSFSSVEALSACESVGWWGNNGNCVSNDNGVYFCKSDSWYQITDCKQYDSSYN